MINSYGPYIEQNLAFPYVAMEELPFSQGDWVRKDDVLISLQVRYKTSPNPEEVIKIAELIGFSKDQLE